MLVRAIWALWVRGQPPGRAGLVDVFRVNLSIGSRAGTRGPSHLVSSHLSSQGRWVAGDPCDRPRRIRPFPSGVAARGCRFAARAVGP